MSSTFLFVYGTLMRAQCHHHLMGPAVFIHSAHTMPLYRLFDTGPYPVMVDDPENGLPIQGEIWEVDDEALTRLDAYEGVPNLYKRRPVALHGFVPTVLAYIYEGKVAGFADSGTSWPRKQAARQAPNNSSNR